MYQRSNNLCACVLALCCSNAAAAEFNYKQLLTGERAAGFAGAYVALSDDNTGMFYNPAGMVHNSDAKSTAGINLISATGTEYKNAFGGANYRRESIEIVPGFLGSMWKLGDTRVGASLVVVDSTHEDQAEVFTDVTIGADAAYDELYVQNDYTARTYNMGVSGAWPLSPHWSAGGTFYLQYKDKDSSLLQRLSRDQADGSAGQDAVAILIATNTEDTEIGIRPILGVMYRDERMSFGATAGRAFALTRDYRYSFIGDAQAGGNLAVSYRDESSHGTNGPWQVSVAGALFSAGTGTITSMQLDYYSARRVSGSADPGRVPPRDLGTHEVVNLAFGMEIPWNQSWSYRWGIYSNLANNKVLRAAAFEGREEIDMYGLTFSASRLRQSGNWTAGIQVATGTGRATLGDIGFGSTAATSAAVDAKRQRFNIFVSTSL